jgi:phosphatidate cytidylyltransferase
LADSSEKSSGGKRFDPRRIITGVSTAAIILGVLMLDHWTQSTTGFTIAWGAIIALSLYEYFVMSRKRDFAPLITFGIAGGVLLALAPVPTIIWSAIPIALLMALVIDLWRQAKRKVGRVNIRSVLLTLSGSISLGLAGCAMTKLRFLHTGEDGWKSEILLLMIVAIAKCGDSMAYFVGRSIGRHKMAPKVSPNKTWEGAAGGLAASIGVAAIGSALIPSGTFLPLGLALLFGTLVGIASQLGDLAESWYKRKMGVKDSGGILPHYGGILDLIDAFLFAAPAAYFLLAILR